ncbi:MAG: hypothetical protein RKE49_06525 [Oceanicaulis sp.]
MSQLQTIGAAGASPPPGALRRVQAITPRFAALLYLLILNKLG